jgi:hypothetical protein
MAPVVGFMRIATIRGRRLVLDAATVAAIALVLAAFYCMSRIDQIAAFRLLFPHLDAFTFRIHAPVYYPWTDLAENIYLGFLVAHGARIYEASTTVHMPGVPQFVGFFLWLAGFSRAVPSPETAAAAYLVACFATLLFQAACLYAPLRLLRFSSAIAAALALAICGYTAFGFDFAMPMSETLIAYWLVLVPLLAARMVFAADGESRIAAAVLLGGPVTLGCLMLGLTVAPANALIALACLAAALWELRRAPRMVGRTLLHNRACRLAYALVLAIGLASAATVQLGSLYFWAIEVNLAYDYHPWTRIVGSFAAHLSPPEGYIKDPVGSRFPELVVLLGVLAVPRLTRARQEGALKRTALRVAVFSGLIFAAAVLTQWRFNDGYKAVPLFGLTVGVMLLALAGLPARWRNASDLWLIPLFAVAAAQVMYVPAALAYTTRPVERPAVFEDLRICRSNEKRDCRCVQGTVWGPQLFLLNDIRACPNRVPTFNHLVGTHPITRQWLIEDARNPTVAFWVFDSDALMRQNGIPPDVIRLWNSHARCARLGPDTRLCHAP